MPDKAKENIKNESSAKSSIEKLMEKYAAVEEDDAIRQTWNNTDKREAENRKKGNSKYTSYYYSPKDLKNDTIPDVKPKMAEAFENAKSNFDSDSIMFSEIELSPVQEQTEEEKPAAKKTAKKKAETEEKKPTGKKTTKEKDETEEKPTTEKTTRKKKEPEVPENTFQTNTRVVFEDRSVDDGIRRHTEDEISNAFLTNGSRKKRFFRRRDK